MSIEGPPSFSGESSLGDEEYSVTLVSIWECSPKGSDIQEGRVFFMSLTLTLLDINERFKT